MTSELEAFRAADFDWARQLKSIWRDPPYHVASLHQQVLDDIIDYFRTKTCDPESLNEPLGRVIVGPAGYGKTHLIGELRSRVWAMDGWFVLLDFIGIKDFWSSVALGFLNSLQVRMTDGQLQYDHLILKLASLLGITKKLTAVAERSADQPQQMIAEMSRLFARALSRHYPFETAAHRDVVTALILLISDDLDCHSVAHGWLQGMALDPDEVRSLGFRGENSAIKVVQGLSWLMSLVGPTLIAIDQIDAIVTASNSLMRATAKNGEREQEEAQSIVDALAEGLMDLHETKRRAVTVVSCLEATWKVLNDRTPLAVAARYYAPKTLRSLPSGEIVRGIIESRVGTAYEACGFHPPYPTWPFAESALGTAVGFSPRQLLRACEEHRQHCVAAGNVSELPSFNRDSKQRIEGTQDYHALDALFGTELKAAADTGAVIDMDTEEGESRLRELLDGTLRLFEKHLDLPDDIDSVVQRDPDQRRPSLHGRLSFTFRSEGDREQHYCFRILAQTSAIAFQSRLKAAMTASGIDTLLKFRHLFILRRTSPPGGPKSKTKALVDQFLKAGGKFIAPTENDLRTFVALEAMAARKLPDFEAWLRVRRPLFAADLFKEAGLCPPKFLESVISGAVDKAPPQQPADKSAPPQVEVAPDEAKPVPAEGKPEATKQKPAAAKAKQDAPPAPSNVSTPSKPETPPVAAQKPAAPVAPAERIIPIGRRFTHGALGDAMTLRADLLCNHIAVLAGAGSGKTVFMRRIIEEAALLGIPSIVLDPNNDLSRLGDVWPMPPNDWSDEEKAKAAAYHACSDVVVWTPGVSSGNPVSLNLLPDFAALADRDDLESQDERAQAVEMARATLEPFIGGGGAKAGLRRGVLADALRAFARGGGGTLASFIQLLAELPEDVSEIDNAGKMGIEMANQLRAAISTNPLLQSVGEPLDPKKLFAGENGRTRISVINLAGLGSDDARDSFVNRLHMALFTYIKRHPSRTGCLYVIDEAQNFAPSGAGTACKASTLSLVAQARKYGLGMMFATQAPKGIDNKIVTNCTTHVYGRMGSQATIDAIKEMMAAKGGTAGDIGKLTKGEFYFSTDGSLRPFKIRTPLCLSYHPANPPTVDEVIAKARQHAA